MRRAGIVFCPWNGIMSYSNPNYLKTHLPLSSRKHLWIASEIRVRCTEYAQRHSYPVHPSTLAILLFQAWHNDVANDKGCTLDSTARHQSETWQKRRWRITAETIRPSHWETAKIAKVSNRDAIVWVLVVSSVGCASDLYTGLWQGHLLQKIWSCLPPIVGDIQACPCSQQDWNTLKLPSQNAKDQWTCTIVMVGQSCQFGWAHIMSCMIDLKKTPPGSSRHRNLQAFIDICLGLNQTGDGIALPFKGQGWVQTKSQAHLVSSVATKRTG